VLGVIFIVLLPGPNSLYVLSVATRRGVRAGCGRSRRVPGRLGADGADHRRSSDPAEGRAGLFWVIKSVGAAYLCWIGLQLLVSALRPKAEQAGEAAQPDHPFSRALVISLLNPKAILFYLSFFLQFVDPAYPHQA
jgi:leucine efflux protein